MRMAFKNLARTRPALAGGLKRVHLDDALHILVMALRGSPEGPRSSAPLSARAPELARPP